MTGPIRGLAVNNPLRCRIAALIILALSPFASAWAAQTVGPVTDDIGVVRIPKGAPIQIGGACVLSGPDTASRATCPPHEAHQQPPPIKPRKNQLAQNRWPRAGSVSQT
jgi:hypothetical protein